VRTVGVSAKVWLPLLAGVTVGTILLVAGLFGHDEGLKVAGTSVLLAAAGHAGIGYLAPPSEVAGERVAHIESRRKRA
jgi:hypothetical protein